MDLGGGFLIKPFVLIQVLLHKLVNKVEINMVLKLKNFSMTLKKYLSLTFTLSIYCLLPLNHLKAGVQLKDQFVTNETLDSMCKNGTNLNAIGREIGEVGGFFENSYRELVANGKMSYQDFTKLQSWFSTYCPSGW